MRLVVFGSTGRTGRLVVEQALAAGHDVTAVARRPAALALRHPHLTCRAGDVLDAHSTAAAVAGHDAVISAIGPGTTGACEVYSRGAAHLITALRSAERSRLICLAAAAADPAMSLPSPLALFTRFVLRPLLRGPYEDALRMEAALGASELAWTVLRAPRLTNGPRTGRYRTAVRAHLRHPMSLSRADLADCALRLVPDAASYRAWVEVAY
jgi:putative NADH-flavin reductase